MAIWAWNNSSNKGSGGAPLFDPIAKLSNDIAQGHILIWDQNLGAFINVKQETIVNSIQSKFKNLGIGTPLLADPQPDSDNISFRTLLPGTNITFNTTPNTITINSTASLSSTTSIIMVDDIPQRDSLTVGAGTVVYVEDKGDGEYAFFMWNGTIWIKLSEQETSGDFPAVYTQTILWSSPGITLFGEADASAIVTNVKVNVTIPFNGSPVLNIGDSLDNSSLMPNAFMDLSIAAVYEHEPNIVYSVDTPINAYFIGGGASAGSADVTVTLTKV